jgi:hypothetical protein
LVFLVVSFLLVFPPISYMNVSSPHLCYMSCPSHPPWLDQSLWWGVQIMKLGIMEFLQPHVTSFLFGPNILLSTFFSNTLNARDQVSQPYINRGKILLFTF